MGGLIIVKISAAGDDPGNLMRYLAGPGRNGEHERHRIVAGTVDYSEPLTNDLANQVAADLRMPNQMHPDVTVKGGSIYHVSISLAAGEGDLPDAKWRAVAEDYMRGMGYDDPAKATMRWTAVNHGLNTKGNPHIHIVANLVREDGTKANTWQDMPRSQKLATKLEQKHGLDVLQSRLAEEGAASVPYTAGEAGKAAAKGLPIERVELERRIRAAASAAGSEAEFVRRVRADGLLIRPYPASGEVTGYSAGIPAPPGEKQVFFQGGRVARDLSLPRLRASWPESGGAAAEAAHEWRIGVDGTTKVQRPTKPIAAPPVDVVNQELAELGARLASRDPVEFATASHDLAGVLAAGSRAVEGGQIGPIGRASRDAGAWAQTRKRPVRRARTTGVSAAMLLLQALDPTGPLGQAVMYRQVIDTAMSLYRLHRAHRPVVGQVGRRLTVSDGIEESIESMATVGVTLAARGVQEWAEGKRERVEKGDVRLAEDEWQGMSDEQREQALPAPGPLDYRPGTPEGTFAATAEQQARVAALAHELGAPDVADARGEMTRIEAAAALRAMEADLGPDRTSVAYTKAAVGPVGRPVPDRVERVKDPLLWKDAGAPVTPPQAYTLRQAGLTAEEIQKLDKGHASLVITAVAEGPTQMRMVYEQSTGQATTASPPVSTVKPKPPVVTPPVGRNPRRL